MFCRFNHEVWPGNGRMNHFSAILQQAEAEGNFGSYSWFILNRDVFTRLDQPLKVAMVLLFYIVAAIPWQESIIC